MRQVHSIAAVLIFILGSCSTGSNKQKGDNITNNDSCRVMVFNFNYPDDLNRMDSLNYICRDSFLQALVLKNDLKIVPLFSDRNYVLLNYDFRTKLLYDKRNDLFFCFKRSVDSYNFNKESIYSIYILNKHGLPLYLINQFFSSVETDITKL